MDFAIGLLGILFVLEAVEYWDRDNNSTNIPHVKKHWWSRSGEKSGLVVYKDHATGVQYIKSAFFERMQVRIDKDGNPYTGE